MMNQLSKQRTMTFSKDIDGQEGQPFALNVNAMESLGAGTKGHKKQKGVNIGMEKIEEKEEYDLRKASGGNSNELKK